MSDKIFTPSNPRAQDCVKNVMKYLSDITYEKVITGQHTQTMAMEELHLIREKTGHEPALLGFELLSYSPNINYTNSDIDTPTEAIKSCGTFEDCMTEVTANYGTLKRAWEWAERKGLITFTWHWFSPLGGRSKSFFTANTDFDASLAVIDGTPENKALISDMDMMAGLLRPFCDKGVPILWRPFHEGDGTWFWWGAKGADTLIKLWNIMYDRYTKVHSLNNLIWVWNAPTPGFYPGDDRVDIISRDMYPDTHTSCAEQYHSLTKITSQPKITYIAETGGLPDIDTVCREGIGWSAYMTWSKDFCLTERVNSFDYLKALYSSPAAVTKENLPELY